MSQAIDKHVRAATKPNGRPPKPKHIDPLLASTFQRGRALTDIVHALAARLDEREPEVAFKALIVLHTLVRNGGVAEVLATVAAGQAAQQLKALAGRGIPERASYGGGYAVLVRSYAAYLDGRVRAFRELHHDVIRSSESDRAGSGTSNRLRNLTVDRGLLREIGITQKVGNAVLNADFFSEDLRDALVIVAAQMCFKDVLALYAGINEGIINMLEHYFEMAKTDAARALELYRRFVSQTEKVVGYLSRSRRVSQSLGFQVPKLRHAPTGLATALQEYLEDPNFEQNRLEYKESKRIADGGAPSSTAPAPRASKPSPSAAAPTPSELKQPEPAPAPAPKPPTNNQAVQDFFASIDTNPSQSTFAVPHDTFSDMYGGMWAQQPAAMGIDPSQAYGMQMGMASQPTGYNPFAAPQMLAGQPTGFGGGMLGPQATGVGMAPAQPTGFTQGFTSTPFGAVASASPPPQQGLTAQQTGTFNPFRPGAIGTQTPVGVDPTGLQAQSTGFQAGGTAGGGVQPQLTGFAIGGQQPPLAAQPTATGGTTNRGPSPAHLPPVRDRSGSKSPPPARSAGAAKPLSAQKTGSRNPFAPPGGVASGGSSPHAASRPTLPTLSELAEQGVNNKYGLGAEGWDGSDPTAPGSGVSNTTTTTSGPASGAGTSGPVVPQETGLLGTVASEFTSSGQAGNMRFHPSQQPQQPQHPQQPQPTGGAVHAQTTGLTNSFGSLSLGGGAPSPSHHATPPTTTPLASQPTGNVRPFQPESSFGAQLAAQTTGQAGGGGPATTPSNPFGAAVASSSTGGVGGGGLSAQPTGFGGGSSGFTSPGLPSGLTPSPAPPPVSSAIPGSSGGGAGFTGVGNGSITGTGFVSGSGPGLAPQPTASSPSPLASQTTGVPGSSVKPFQPSSAFGQAQLFGQGQGQGQGQAGQLRSQATGQAPPNTMTTTTFGSLI